MSYARLSDSEREIMEFIWSKNMQGVNLKDLSDYFNNEKQKSWKKQAIRVFLDRLKEKGYIHVYIDTETKRYVYVPKYTKQIWLNDLVRTFFKNFFDNSLDDFMLAFTGGKKLSKEESEELKKYISED